MADMDRGYAWVVMVASCILQLFGFGSSVGGAGVMLISFSNAFPDADRAAISWIGSLRAFQLLASPIAVLLIKKFGCRAVTIVGAIISAAGIAIASVSTHVWHAYLTYGILGGIGVALTYTCSTTVLGEYFDKRKNIAFPVSCLGNSLGLVIFPFLLRIMLDNIGHSVTLYVTAALKIVEVACGIVFKPNKRSAMDIPKEAGPLMATGHTADDFTVANFLSEPDSTGNANTAGLSKFVDREERQRGSDLKMCPSVNQNSGLNENVSEALIMTDGLDGFSHDNAKSNKAIPGTVSFVSTTVAASNENAAIRMLRLLRDWQCWCLLVHAFCWGFTVISTEVLAPISIQSRGVSDANASLGLTLFGAGMLFSSLIMLAVGARKYDRFGLYLRTCGALGIASILLSVWSTTTAYFIICSIYGFIFGILISLFLSVVSDFKSPALYADLFGLYILFNGIGGLVGPVLMGVLQTSVSDQASWCLCGAVGLFGTAILIPSYVLRRRSIRL